ncbi:MAG: Uma2 family endonuclease [Chitinophagaceae bacterium]|nr:Uma2 family endonuclease [Chitinophagaceae bacterium]
MKVEEPAVKYENLMSPQEYLEWERTQELKHEYTEGFITAMQGASLNHNKILVNLIRSVGSFLKKMHCDIYPSDLRTYVKAKESYFYPDASIVCGEDIDFGDHDDISQYPSVIFEIAAIRN